MKLRIVLLTVSLLCSGSYLCAQEELPAQAPERNTGQLPREVPSPERNARKITSAMKRELNLTDKQYDKLYALNLKEQKELFASTQGIQARGQRGSAQGMGNRPPGGGGGGMGGGRMGGGQPPMDGGGGGGGQRPPIGGDSSGQGMPGGPSAKNKSEEDWQKAAAKKEKKIKKILTADQYSKWQSIAAEFAVKPTRPGKGGHPDFPGQPAPAAGHLDSSETETRSL